VQYSGEQESWKAGNVPYSRSTDRKWSSNLYSNNTPSRKVYRKEQPKGQPEGDAVKGKIRKRWVENKSTECASTKKIEIRPTMITVAWRRGWSNSKTTKWGLLERVVPICALMHFLCLRSSQEFNAFYPTTSVRRSPIFFEPDLQKWMRVLYSFCLHSQCRCAPCWCTTSGIYCWSTQQDNHHRAKFPRLWVLYQVENLKDQ